MEHKKPKQKRKLSAKAQQEIKTITEEEARLAQWKAELLASEPIQDYLKDYDEDSVKGFIDSYVSNKNLWFRFGKMYAKMKEDSDLRFDNQANEYLDMILQKKLFEKQCLWRAEQITLPGIEFTCDFRYWQMDVFNCPFLEPITAEDIALCQRYIEDGDMDPDEDMNQYDWQEYDDIKEGYKTDNEEGYYLSWYEFWDTYRGTRGLLDLPDIRGDKEMFYRDIYFESVREEREEMAAASKKQWEERKPSIYTHDKEVLEKFVKKFEDKEMQFLYNGYKWSEITSDAQDIVEEHINLLLAAQEPVPMEAHENWIEGLRLTVRKYKRKKIIEALPRAWEQYMMNIQMGIAFPEGDVYLSEDVKRIVRNQIFTGRRLNGEPEDFNF
jgi:hypothetical protein